MRAILLLVLSSTPAWAHDDADGFSWLEYEPWITGPLALATVLYLAGLARLWRRRLATGVARWRAACFGAGVAALVADFVTPLHTLADRWFFAHMAEHEMLMAIAAPLLALSRPLAVMMWGMPAALRPAIATMTRWTTPAWRRLERPATATAVHALAVWVWHVPALFDAALANEATHAAQHLSFLGTALLFWSALLDDRTFARYGAALLYLFLTSVHTMLLGALLVFAQRPWYASTAEGGALSPLEDQQLAGALMWVPGGLVYVAAALIACALWIGGSVQRRAGRAAA